MKKKYVFRVKLKGFEKYITREIAIPRHYSLSELAIGIILSFRGNHSHLYDFVIDGKKYSIMEDDFGFEEFNDMRNVFLNELDLDKKTKIKFIATLFE